MQVRKPAVAGAFYPKDPAELLSLLRQIFAQGAVEPISTLKGVVSPHAGYVYAGLPQAAAISAIPQGIETVVLVGPTHYFPFSGGAVYPGDAWLTPLGEVPVDQEVGEALVAELPSFFLTSEEYHAPEHSLEVIVPLLQYRLGDGFSLVPIVVGEARYEELAVAGEALARVLQSLEKPAVIVASSDLYHGYSYEEGRATDRHTLETLLTLDGRLFYLENREGRAMACGALPIVLNLEASLRLGANRAEVLAYTNSLDVLGQRHGYFVGYAAVAFYEE